MARPCQCWQLQNKGYDQGAEVPLRREDSGQQGSREDRKEDHPFQLLRSDAARGFDRIHLRHGGKARTYLQLRRRSRYRYLQAGTSRCEDQQHGFADLRCSLFHRSLLHGHRTHRAARTPRCAYAHHLMRPSGPRGVHECQDGSREGHQGKYVHPCL